jgi:GT2 family glycosyltransferase
VLLRRNPLISIIIPVHNGGAYLGRCLDALLATTTMASANAEVLVVDDASTDDSAGEAQARGVEVLRLAERGGSAGARNRGASVARGKVLLFIDADVVVRPQTVARIRAHFDESGPAAVFGSYDDAPEAAGFFSQYKNLLHHFTHQHGCSRAETFWSGCGAVRREAFLQIGGFDEKIQGIEDIELGYRLRDEGYSILLDKELQVKHLKRWTLVSLLHADIFLRALPWSKLMLKRGHMTDDLNLQKIERAKAAAVVLSFALLPLTLVRPALVIFPLLLLCAVMVLNRRLYTFFLRSRGCVFAVAAIFFHLLYYSYSSVVFACCWVAHNWKQQRGAVPAGETDVVG